MSRVVIGAFDDPAEVTQVTSALTQAGVPANGIRVIGNHAQGAQYAGGQDIVTPLQRFGVSQKDARHYAEVVRRGGSLVAAMAPDERVAAQAQQVMDRFESGVDLEDRVGRYRQAGYTDFDATAPAFTADQARAEREQYRIPIVEEQLAVGKRTVETGRVRVVARIIEVPVEQQVTLREEHLHVERHAVDRPVTAADAAAVRENTIEVTEHSEVPVVSKQARVVEEVVVSTEASQHTETVRDTVRRTEVDVDEDVADDLRTTGQQTTRTTTGR